MDWLAERMDQELKERSVNLNLRTLRTGHDHLIDFVSNDYLGLAKSKKLHNRILTRCEEETRNGAGGSRLLSGNSRSIELLEKRLSRIFESEAAVLFNSGYHANQGLISAVAKKGDTIFYDVFSHVCIKEGVILSKASSIPFAHNDLQNLEEKLARCDTNKFVIVESVYSMDGDASPLKELIDLCAKYSAHIIVDEAHTTGVEGERGGGILCKQGLQNEVFARVFTFGKAMGVHGACVCGSKQLIDYLINFSRPFIYTTALPIHSVISIDEAFSFLEENLWLQKVLRSKVKYFKEAKSEIFQGRDMLAVDSCSAIQPMIVPGNGKVTKVAKMLVKQGFDCRPLLSPIVARNQERLRICLHVYNSEEQIDHLLSNLSAQL